MPSPRDISALEELRAYETQEQMLRQTLTATWTILERSQIAARTNFELLNGRLAQASANLRSSRYATTNCMALLDEHLVIVDEDFLLEIEAAIRAFETSPWLATCPYLRSDEDLLGLTDRISADPHKYLGRMRRLTARSPEKERAIIDTVVSTYLFFVGHELGHLISGKDARNFTTFVKDDDPLEYQLANAIVKLRRHAEEFASFGFNLPGFERVLLAGDEIERSSAALQQQIADLHLAHSLWFQDEVAADDIGLRIVGEHLAAMADDQEANTCMLRAVRGVFAVAVYAWYRDLRRFCNALDTNWLTSTTALSMVMVQARRCYLRAAALFGDVHRFTLLRAERFVQGMLAARSNIFDKGTKTAVLRGDDSPSGQELLGQAVERYNLLCILMDTAIKIAYVGVSTAWMLEKDRERGTPQLFMMQFESIAAAMRRLDRMMHRAS